MQNDTSDSDGRPRIPRWALAALLACLGFVYTLGLGSDPLRWEEPRRALVAMEMIQRGDYVVPRLLGQPYLNKPPLQNWLIVLAAGGRAERVGPWSVRLPSVLATAGIALALWWLGTTSRSGPRPLPALVFLTFGILPQYGRPGEIDLVFTFWVTLALAAFELGRRRDSAAVRWLASHALLAGGILTKGIAPLFFHPPTLIAVWRLRLRLRPIALLAGLLLMLALVAAWVVPYAASGPVLALRDRLGSEVAQRTTDSGLGQTLQHLARYPLLLVGTAAPWSLLGVAGLLRRPRSSWKGLLTDPWVRLCAYAVSCGSVAFAFVPGTLPRYLIPVLPFAAVVIAAALERLDRPHRARLPWWLLLLAWCLAAPLLGAERLAALPAGDLWASLTLTTLAGILAITACAAMARRTASWTAALLAVGLLYGVFHAGILERRTAHTNRRYVTAAQALASHLRPDVPVVIAEGTDRKLTFPLASRLGRTVASVAPPPPYDLVGPVDTPLPPRTRQMAESGGFAVWRVREPRPTP